MKLIHSCQLRIFPSDTHPMNAMTLLYSVAICLVVWYSKSNTCLPPEYFRNWCIFLWYGVLFCLTFHNVNNVADLNVFGFILRKDDTLETFTFIAGFNWLHYIYIYEDLKKNKVNLPQITWMSILCKINTYLV